MKALFILIFILLNAPNLFAKLQGQAKIDSLLSEIPNAKADTNHVNLLKDLSFEYYLINPDEGIKYGEQGLKLAKELSWKKGEATSYHSLGVVYFFGKADYTKALEYYGNALKINEEIGNKRGIAANLGGMGVIYYNQSDYPKALEYYSKALKIDEELGNKSGIAIHLGNIGLVYSNQSDYPKALEYYSKALKIDEELGNKNGIARHLGNIGNIYSNQSEYPKALEYFHKALKINEKIGKKDGIAYNLGNMGSLYLKLSQDSVSIEPSELNEYVSLNKDINLNNSIEYLLQSIEILEEIGELDGRSTNLKNLADAYKQKGDYKNSDKFIREHHKIKDSVFNQEKQKKIDELTKQREEDQNKQKLKNKKH